MRSRTSLLYGAALALALLLISSPCRAAGWYSTVDVFYGWSVTGTSVTTVNIWEYYDGARPWAEGTLRRNYQYLAWNSRFELYDMQASAQATASLQPGDAFYSMDGLHYAIIDGYQYYLSSSQGGYYYYDPAAQPPYIYGINPNTGVSGTPGYIEIYGSNLAPSGTTPQVSMPGANLWIVYQSDNQINVYYDYVSLGQRWLSVTTIYGTSNYVMFTALAGDPTPSISSISPDVWQAGTTTNFTISGTGFGTNPGLTISGGWIDNYGVYSGWDTGMNAWVTVSPYAPDQGVTVTVTSNGYWGNPFLPQYPNQPNYGSATATLQALPSCSFSIPANGQQYTLSGNYLTTSVPLRVDSNCSGSASWSITFSYETSGGKGSSVSGPYYLSGPLNQTLTLNVPEGVGGRADATVAVNVSGPPPPPLSAVFYVVGRTIPDSVITDRLVSLYAGGARPRLFVGVASRESSYMQFASRTLYGLSARWPKESYDGGSHIGLLMVPVSMARGYSFWTNTADGVSLFIDEKIPICRSHVASVRASHPGLRDLTSLEYEMCALVKYGEHASLGWYWVPNASGADWIVDPEPTHAAAVAYADDIVARMYEH